MSTATCCAGYGLLLVTPLTAWISNVYSVCASRLLMNTRVSVRPSWRGANSTLSSQCEHERRSALHFLHTMLYTTSLRPPVSRGECHSRVTDVSFTTDRTLRGPEGTPKEVRKKKKIFKQGIQKSLSGSDRSVKRRRSRFLTSKTHVRNEISED